MGVVKSWRRGLVRALTGAAVLAPAYGQSAPAPLPVEVVVAQPQRQPAGLDLTGTVEARETRSLGFQTAGRLAELTVEVGDHVAEGAILGRLDATQAALALEAARANSRALEAGLEQARLARSRAADLRAQAIASQATLERAERDLRAAEAALDEARAQEAKAVQTQGDMVLRAPIAGQVTARAAEVGEILAAGQMVVALAPASARDAVFDLPNITDLRVSLGQEIALRGLGRDGGALVGHIREISPLVRAATGTLRLRIALGEDAPALGSGVSARFDWEARDAIALPAAAMVSDHGRPAVWVVNAQSLRAELRPVEVSRFGSTTVEIASGVAAGEWVIGAGAHLAFPDRPVQPLDPVMSKVEGDAP